MGREVGKVNVLDKVCLYTDSLMWQDELLNFIVNLPYESEDEQLYLLAGKILIYFAESESV